MNTKLYIITSIFNPFNFASRYRLYEAFKKHMSDCGVELFTVECAFGNDPFRVTTSDNPMNLQIRSNSILWVKERLINLAAEKLFHVFPSVEFMGWIDADVTFLEPNWAAIAVQKMTHIPVIQPFGTAINLNSGGDPMWNCPSSFRAFIEGRGFHQEPPLPVSYTYKGHPGLAWCCTRTLFERMGGLYDVCVAGSADSIMSNAFKGDYSVYLPGAPSQGMISSMAKWQERVTKIMRGQVGFIGGSVAHHWHGHSESRGYEKRWAILSFHQFDPAEDLRIEENGLYRWTGNKPRLEDDIRLSLGARNEDAI